MELRQMRYFLAVAETLHFHHAAEMLHLSQPSLSQQIRQLEDELGVQLFERSQRKVRLTAAGAALVPRLKTMLHSLDEAIDSTQRIHKGIAGPLHMGFVSTALVGKLPTAMKQLQTACPEIELQLRECEPHEQIAEILQGNLDIGFVHARLDQKALASLVVQRDLLMVALPEELAGSEDAVALESLAKHTSILPSPFTAFGFYDHVLRAYELAGVKPRNTIYTNLITGAISLVAGGMGIAVVPQSFQQLHVPGVCYRRLQHTPPAVELLAVWKSENHSHQLARFLEILKKNSAAEDESQIG